MSADPTTSDPVTDAGPATNADPPARSDPLTSRPVVQQRHPWRWAATALVLVLSAQVLHGLVTNPFYQWDRFFHWFAQPSIIDGLLLTFQVAAWSAVFGLLGGIVLALMRLSGNPVLQTASWIYIWIFRAVPLIVLLLILFNFSALYPELSLGIPFGPAFAEFTTTDLLDYIVIGIIGLSLNEAAHAAEVVRAGLNSVDQGQREAADALGLSRARQFRRIVLPQALRSIVPNYVNLLIGLIKSSSLVFYVSLLDLFGTVQMLSSTFPGDIVPLLLVGTVWYVILTSVLSVLQFYVERYFARGALRTVPPTPLQRLRQTLRKRFA